MFTALQTSSSDGDISWNMSVKIGQTAAAWPLHASVLAAPSFFFWPHQAACGILVPQPAMAPTPPALKAWSLNHWTAREVPLRYFKKKKKIIFGCFGSSWLWGFSLVVASGGCSLLGVHGLLIAVASLVASHRLDSGGPQADLL